MSTVKRVKKEQKAVKDAKEAIGSGNNATKSKLFYWLVSDNDRIHALGEEEVISESILVILRSFRNYRFGGYTVKDGSIKPAEENLPKGFNAIPITSEEKAKLKKLKIGSFILR